MTTESYLASTLGGLILICLAVVIRLLRDMNGTLIQHGQTVVVLHTIVVGANGVPGLVDRVQSLHDWRTKIQDEEIIELRRRVGDRT